MILNGFVRQKASNPLGFPKTLPLCLRSFTSARVKKIKYNSNIKQFYIGERTNTAICDYVNQNNLKRVLLIGSQTLDTKTNEISDIEESLSSNNTYYHKITGIQEHNPASDTIHSINMAREHDVDCVCMVGGGSVIDNGKIAALLKNEPVDTWTNEELDNNYYAAKTKPYGYTMLEQNENVKKMPSLIMVPTTLSGTTQVSGYKSELLNMKLGCVHDKMMPECIILDPIISRYTPEWIWNSTAVRCIDHCIEIIASTETNAYWDSMAISTLESVLKNLPMTRQFNNNNDSSNDSEIKEKENDARLECLVGCINALLPILQGCSFGAAHSISYVLGALYQVPHGYTSCVLNSAVLKWNLIKAKEMNDEYVIKKQEIIKNIFVNVFKNNGNDIKDDKYKLFCDEFNQFMFGTSTNTNTNNQVNVDAGDMMNQFVKQMGLPTKLSDVVPDEYKVDYNQIADSYIERPWTKANPIKIQSGKDVVEILRIADKLNR